MNKTKIEWCDSTWNPVTGCKHGCDYCYARRIAGRFGTQLPDRSGYPEAEGATENTSAVQTLLTALSEGKCKGIKSGIAYKVAQLAEEMGLI